MKPKPKKPIENLLGSTGDEPKCVVFPSVTASFHVWHTNAKDGDKCKCGKLTLKPM